ncbi:MAG: hypothetical protein DWG80_05540, partial [Chloroflexi bacterium]|nr:hypothetical protein [Chloroflexota bacterium]
EARRHEGQLLDLERLREALSASAAELACAATALAGARTQHAAQQKADEATRTAQQQAEARLGAAQHALDQARRDDAAAHLRSGLRIGDACPVCGEPITALADHVPADITAAEGVLALATADAREATSATERAIAALAGAAARVAEAERAHEAAEAQRGALSLRLTETGAAAIGIDDAIATARAAAADQVAIAAAKRTLARDHHVQSQAIREALARVPDTVEPSDGVEPPPAPPAVLTAIAGALRDHASAVEAARSAATALERTRSAAEAADRALDVARRDRERTRQTVTQAQERLAALGGAAGDEDATRRALVAVEEQARQVEELAAQIGKARETLASREAALAAAEQAVTRAEELRTLRQTTLAQTRSQWEAAEGELLAAWQRQFAEARPDLRVLKATMEECEADRVRIATELERVRWGIQQANAQIEQAGRMRDEVAVQRARADLVGAIGNDLRGDRFIAFLLHESMQMLAVDASDRLGQFTNGRYALKADEDEFAVIDHLNGDEERSVKTLSGGETFLASLALALSLSEHLPEIAGTGGAISLDSLFLDEGFGALDAEALDLAVQGLETLADGTRMIGVISHVEELAERLTDRIRVEKGPHGSTVAG